MFRLAERQKTTQHCLWPMLLLVPELPLKVADDKTKFITFELSVYAGQPAGSTASKICSGFQGRIPPIVD